MSDFIYSCCGKEKCDGCPGGSTLVKKSEYLQEKIAQLQQQPFWQRALSAQANQPYWDSSKSILHNIGSNVAQARNRGKQLIADQRQVLDMQSALQPGFAMQRMRHFLRHGDPVVTNTADRLLLDTENVGL